MASGLLYVRQPRSVAALAGRRQSSLNDGDNFWSPLATYGNHDRSWATFG